MVDHGIGILKLLYARLAQLVELPAYIRTVGGLSPSAGTKSYNSQDSVDLWTPFKVVRGSENNLRRGEVKDPRNMLH